MIGVMKTDDGVILIYPSQRKIKELVEEGMTEDTAETQIISSAGDVAIFDDDSSFPHSALRDAWTLLDGTVVVDESKMISVAQEAIRIWRTDKISDAGHQADNLFQEWQLALSDGEDVKEKLAAYRETKDYLDYLRNLPEQCIGKSAEELTTLLDELGIS
ncbi:hypothetical protein [Parasphaerochaeta coccoides]|uniref:Uncharacterized protein n=1 Tax=Parasphaerochaeta coccoides (strain ATCC BAA-1237 / DSM 17374 / SPN1) TaxID=760011 RepID=F4GHC9_PARC1|nr:hypothetical protein [Parasphaerochaeta coccoides]AEC02028.1 hypothetical protein Spico_0803 [Parasphaerochaeta coccoides DSM 17374]